MYLGGFYLAEIWFSGAPTGIPAPTPVTPAADGGRGGLILERPLKRRRYEERREEKKKKAARKIAVIAHVPDVTARTARTVRGATAGTRFSVHSLFMGRRVSTGAGANKIALAGRLNRYGFFSNKDAGAQTKHATGRIKMSATVYARARRIAIPNEEDAISAALQLLIGD